MVFQLQLDEIQSLQLRKAINSLYQFGYDDRDSMEIVTRVRNPVRFLGSPDNVTVVVQCVREDLPTVVGTLQYTRREVGSDGSRFLKADHSSEMSIPLHLLKFKIGDQIFQNRRVMLFGSEGNEEIECVFRNGDGHPVHFSSLQGSGYIPDVTHHDMSIIPDVTHHDMSIIDYTVRIGIAAKAFCRLMVQLSNLGSSVTAVINEDSIDFHVLNIHIRELRQNGQYVVHGDASQRVNFYIHHWRAFCQAHMLSDTIWLYKTRTRRTILFFPVDGGHLLFVF